jgi:hypothetical protein
MARGAVFDMVMVPPGVRQAKSSREEIVMSLRNASFERCGC